ncbi:hypothetical protein AVEN_2881-1 [Araneus ventricosus]|uniref:Reverse transcriptase domain-containing protein n=1 Tax=Araneus ventricosus TaxID=182803 RepID=A0A4Y2VCZ7_ARAVE|nr:hypothetical protein AVEN_2881-1 [Araneus ventricosus]
MYADDTALLAQGRTPSQALTPLQNYLTKLEAWLIRWKIKLNVDKAEAILFFMQKNDCPKINIYDTPVDWKNEVKYLGVILDKNLTFKSHANHAREKFNKALRFRVFANMSKLQSFHREQGADLLSLSSPNSGLCKPYMGLCLKIKLNPNPGSGK